MYEKIESIVIEALKGLYQELENECLLDPKPKTKIFGGNGILDSLALVSLISDIEFLISDEFNVDVVLADEKAMSQKVSPFRNVDTLSKYIEFLLKED